MVGTESFADAKGEFVRRRNRLAPVYLERAREALRQLLPQAGQFGVKLGIEGRSHYEQVPSEDEMNLLMKEFGDNPFIGYWHDFGHIQRKHNLLILNHEQFLRRMSSHLIGGHVNDVKWPARDHQVPLLGGVVPFERLLPFFSAWSSARMGALQPCFLRRYPCGAQIVDGKISADAGLTIL